MVAQSGRLSISPMAINIVDVEISWSGGWVSLNDGFRYKIHPNGFGKQQHTKRRRKTSSEFFSGEFVLSETEDNLPKTLTVWVYGASSMEVADHINLLVSCFKQDPFTIRTRTNEVLTTEVSSGSADIVIDQSHVYLHNMMALAELTFSVLPGAEMEMIL